MNKLLTLLLVSLMSFYTYSQEHPDVGPRITGLFSVEALKIERPQESSFNLNLIDDVNCFIETRDGDNKLDQRINFTQEDIDHNGLLTIKNETRVIKVQFKNNDRNGIDLVINSGRVKGTKGHAELSVSSLEGIEINTYAGHNVTLINGLRRAHFICE